MLNSKIVACYYTYGNSEVLQPEGINGNIMTHLIVGWTGVNDETFHFQPLSPEATDGFRRCVQLKRKYPHLKVMLTCGGGADNGVQPFSRMADDPDLRALFVKTAVIYLGDLECDGLDLDWEFPVWSGRECDRENFILLLRELRSAFDSHPTGLLLTVAAGAPKLIVDPAYDIPAMAPLIDFLNLMCYDFNLFKLYNPFASHNAPLYRRSDQKLIFSTMNTVWSAEYWLEKGMPREKLVVGVPAYGHTWRLLSRCLHFYNAPCIASGPGGGFISYPAVRDMELNGGRRVFDRQAGVPYLYKGSLWISYEDEESIALKAAWIQKEGFGGAMVFQLNTDDFMGIFSSTGTRFPLISIVHSTLKGSHSGGGDYKRQA